MRLVLLCWTLAGCWPERAPDCADVDVTPGAQVTCKVPGEVDRAFDLVIPASWDGATALPLVVAYHGGGGNRRAAQRVTCPDGEDGPECLVELATARGYAVVLPDGSGNRPLRDVRTWNAGGGDEEGGYCASGAACTRGIDDIGYTEALLREVEDAIPVDPRRVFATGLSNGGAMAHRAACELPERFAAIVAVGGANQHADSGGACGSAAVLHVHGTLDPCWPFEGGGGDCLEQVGRKTSVEETMAGWAQRNGCAATFVDTPLPDRDPADRTTSIRRTWDGCTVATEQIAIEGAGHAWPNGFSYFGESRIGVVPRDFGSELLVDFFDANPKP